MKRTLSTVLAAAVLITPLSFVTAPAALAAPAAVKTATELPAPKPGFRVYPYLTNSAQNTMDLTWISELNTAGTVTVTGPGIGGGKGKSASNKVVLTSSPVYLERSEYTEKELNQSISGLEKGSWLKSNSNYRHKVTVDGLKAGKEYQYTVVQDGVEFKGSFKTAPSATAWENFRVIAVSDSETEPYGRTEHREWELNPSNSYTPGSLERPGAGSDWANKFGNTTRYGEFTLKYPLNQDTAMQENMKHVAAADPDLMMITGDLTQGSGYQPAWDEFFGYVAGLHGTLASSTPLITALGNWETYAALNGGYGSATDKSPAVISRAKFHDYFDRVGDPENPQYKGSYYRTDHGPLTILTLDSTNGRPDENVGKFTTYPVFSGNDTNLTSANLSTDTQGEFTFDQYVASYLKIFPGSTAAEVDQPNMDKDSEQWAWAEEQLADARAKDQIVMVQFHHAAYSNGVHGTPPNHAYPDNQSGTAMRAYTPMFEKYGVSTVISGHDEMFERSWVDEDGDGKGFHSYDVGVAADGLRGEQLIKNDEGEYVPHRFNTHSEWSASADEPETWATDSNGVVQLQDGGLHYGHLQIDVKRTGQTAELVMTPVYLFPVLDKDYNLMETERRVYNDVVTVKIDQNGEPLARG
ncbi:hypothetical protein HD598_001169 [Neomicrococcus aestuarii]|uniref:Calcineurin-like phosphoesterase domain-containing protein n=1 Tax=Neomicrococcus aestuarii TaxID=556325 RepID=A0A7W8WZQ0_9MICC|nr:metallophosphoesterase [Neomicrococcus aestuarii]MBB5512482.1 hypothetical protein [Neomicrococcus aestuarii]